MRKLLVLVAVLAAIPVVLFLSWDMQTRALGNALLADLTAAKRQIIKRDPPPREPKHDNGFQCLAGMLDVSSPAFLATFDAKSVAALEPFITGARPISELPEDVRASMVSFSAWAGSMRDCGQSMQLAWVEGLAPWTRPEAPRAMRLAEAMPALIDFTALELRVLLADGQPEVALERCSTTWALAADQSHLGVAGAKTARAAVKRLAPVCSEALKALPAAAGPVREAIARQWLAVKQRLAPVSEVLEAERLGVGLRTYGWVTDELIRKQLPAIDAPKGEGDRMEAGRKWRAWDEAMREAIADPSRSSEYAAVISDYEQTGAELDALAAAAKP